MKLAERFKPLFMNLLVKAVDIAKGMSMFRWLFLLILI